MAGSYYEPKTTRPIRLSLLGEPVQLTYQLDRLEGGNRFVVRRADDYPHVLLTTRKLNRFRRIKGTLLHTIERQSTPLLFIFEIRPPYQEPLSGELK